MNCIFCGKASDSSIGVEHVISESLGNKCYTLEKGDVCDECNTRFSGFEQIALASSLLAWERGRHALPSKKNKPSKGKVNIEGVSIGINGDSEFRPGIVNITSDQDIPLSSVNPETGTFNILVSGPDEKESVATAKLLLKMGIEALFQTQGEVYDDYNFDEAKKYVLGKSNVLWPFVMPMKPTGQFIDILNEQPDISQELRRNKLKIGYMETKKGNVLFKFSISTIDYIIDLVNRNTDWIGLYLSTKAVNDKIYPPSLRKKFRRKFGLTEDD